MFHNAREMLLKFNYSKPPQLKRFIDSHSEQEQIFEDNFEIDEQIRLKSERNDILQKEIDEIKKEERTSQMKLEMLTSNSMKLSSKLLKLSKHHNQTTDEKNANVKNVECKNEEATTPFVQNTKKEQQEKQIENTNQKIGVKKTKLSISQQSNTRTINCGPPSPAVQLPIQIKTHFASVRSNPCVQPPSINSTVKKISITPKRKINQLQASSPDSSLKPQESPSSINSFIQLPSTDKDLDDSEKLNEATLQLRDSQEEESDDSGATKTSSRLRSNLSTSLPLSSDIESNSLTFTSTHSLTTSHVSESHQVNISSTSERSASSRKDSSTPPPSKTTCSPSKSLKTSLFSLQSPALLNHHLLLPSSHDDLQSENEKTYSSSEKKLTSPHSLPRTRPRPHQSISTSINISEKVKSPLLYSEELSKPSEGKMEFSNTKNDNNDDLSNKNLNK